MDATAFEEALRSALTTIAENVLVAERWITPATLAIDGLGAAEAAARPAPDRHSVWEIVLHVTAWTEWVNAFLEGRDTQVEDWPAVTRTSDVAWSAAREAFGRSQETFRARIAALDRGSLFDAPTPQVTSTSRLVGVASILVHNAYHAGQLVLLSERLRAAP